MKLATIVTQTYGVQIEVSGTYTFSPPRPEVEDIVGDLEDEIVDKAILKYHREIPKHKGDEQTYRFDIQKPATPTDTYHAFTSGVPAKRRVASVLVTVFWTTSRM